MRRSQEQKREKLEKAASELIERLMEWEDTNQAPTLTEIEEEVLKLRKRFGEELVEAVLGEQESRRPSEAPKCQECGKELSNKGSRKKNVESRVGEVEIERNYYHCGECKGGFFPPR